MAWQDISSAPKDGTRVDLWMTNEAGEGWRVTDAYWVNDIQEMFSCYDTGVHEYRTERRSGWFAPHCDYEDDGFCDQPVRNYGKPPVPTWETPTHWQPLPAPPIAGEG